MDFIFMLTHQDRTLPEALEILAQLNGIGLKHIGFKDVGADWETQKKLRRAIAEMGAIAYLEVVSTDARSCLRSAQRARRLGIDRLLGGTDVAATLDILGGSGIEYFPFPGRPFGHPTILGGTPDKIAEDCRRMIAAGCAGVDLLAYRASEAAPLDLVRAARHALGSAPLIIAGSVDTPERIRDLAEAGVDFFTIGSAIFEHRFQPGLSSLDGQIAAILAALREAMAASSAA